MTQLTVINLNPNEYTEGLHYYPFAVNLDRIMGICNTLKGAQATCVEIATEMKKGFRLKEMLNFNAL